MRACSAPGFVPHPDPFVGTKLMEMGRNEMVVWYQSPYPEEYTTLPKIFICEFCLKYMKFSSVMKRHASKCVWKHPPGAILGSHKRLFS